MTRVLFKAHSDNRKLGKFTAASYTEKSTCPDNCELKGDGCYATGGPTAIHWNRLSDPNPESRTKSHYEFEEFLLQLKALPRGHFFRHNVAGDVFGDNNVIDRNMFTQLVDACQRIIGFTFTHKPVGFGKNFESQKALATRATNTELIKESNKRASDNGYGLTVNLSADNIEQADYYKSLSIAPVVCVVPSDHPKHSKTPAGNHMIVCPNEENSEFTCDKCKLCAKPNRAAIIAFRAHGVGAKKISTRIKDRVHLGVLQ